MKQIGEHSDREVLKAWNMEVYIEIAVSTAIVCIGELLMAVYHVPGWMKIILLIILAGYIGYSLLQFIWLNKIKFNHWKYHIAENGVSHQKGSLFRETVIIPINRIQQVAVKQGPLCRKYKLASVEVTNAFESTEIACLSLKKAQDVCEEIQQNILKLGEL